MNDNDDALYEVARRVCHEMGLPWTDPRTGRTVDPPAPHADPIWEWAVDRCQTCGAVIGMGVRLLHLGRCDTCAAEAAELNEL